MSEETCRGCPYAAPHRPVTTPATGTCLGIGSPIEFMNVLLDGVYDCDVDQTVLVDRQPAERETGGTDA